MNNNTQLTTLRSLIANLDRELKAVEYYHQSNAEQRTAPWEQATKFHAAVNAARGIALGLLAISDGLMEHLEDVEHGYIAPELCDRCGYRPHDGACLVPYERREHVLITAQGQFCANFFNRQCARGTRDFDLEGHWYVQGKLAHICAECGDREQQLHPELFLEEVDHAG